jgi:hypothetical protein
MRYRVENFRFRGVAQLPRHRLRFHKRSVDVSAGVRYALIVLQNRIMCFGG